MKDTKKESSPKKPLEISAALKESTQLMASSISPDPSQKASAGPKSLSMNVAEHLLFLMKEVTKDSCDPRNVNAACNCATQMVNLMKVNLKLRDI